MSRIGIVAAGKTGREIYEAALDARQKLLLPAQGRLAISMEWLLEKRVCPSYGIEIDVRDDSDPDLTDAFAAYNSQKRILKIRNSVLRKLPIEDPESYFTICHEIGHIHLHSNPDSYRREFPNHLPRKMCDPEWQADRFAREFMADRNQLFDESQKIESKASYFRMPCRELKILMAELKLEGVIAQKSDYRLHTFLNAQQSDFDF